MLRRLTHRTLVVGITSDVLYPFQLQTELAQNLPNAEMYAIDPRTATTPSSSRSRS